MCGIDGCLEFVSEQPLVAWLPWSSSDIAAILVLSGTSSPESHAGPQSGLSMFLQCIFSNHRHGNPGSNSDLLFGEFGLGSPNL